MNYGDTVRKEKLLINKRKQIENFIPLVQKERTSGYLVHVRCASRTRVLFVRAVINLMARDWAHPTPTHTAPLLCSFCGTFNHVQTTCKHFIKAQQDTQDSVKANQNANRQHQQMHEYAGNASALKSDSDSTNTDFDWLADTGATSLLEVDPFAY